MKAKNTLILVFLVLAAVVLSALIGTLTKDISFLQWITWGDSIGFDLQNVDLAIINFSVSFRMQANVLQVILIGAALLLYKKIK